MSPASLSGAGSQSGSSGCVGLGSAASCFRASRTTQRLAGEEHPTNRRRTPRAPWLHTGAVGLRRDEDLFCAFVPGRKHNKDPFIERTWGHHARRAGAVLDLTEDQGGAFAARSVPLTPWYREERWFLVDDEARVHTTVACRLHRGSGRRRFARREAYDRYGTPSAPTRSSLSRRSHVDGEISAETVRHMADQRGAASAAIVMSEARDASSLVGVVTLVALAVWALKKPRPSTRPP